MGVPLSRRALAAYPLPGRRQLLRVQGKGREGCPGAQTPFGKIVRIPIENDRRMFTPIPRDSNAWEKAYDRRTAVERINSRIDRVLGFELHTIRGLKKMEVRVGAEAVPRPCAQPTRA